MDSIPENQGSAGRDELGRFPPGVSGNPAGRPKGKTIKEMVREYLDEHPDDMAKFVKHFITSNRELAWTMLEGKPRQDTDVTSGGKPIPILGGLIVKSDAEDKGTDKGI